MKVASVEAIARALNEGNVRFIIVGGLAVVAHGYGRLTQDLDLVVELTDPAIRSLFESLGFLGYRPRVPVTASVFADSGQRQRWIAEKGMTVLNFHSDAHRETPVDIFVQEPFDFETEYARAITFNLAPGVNVPVVHLDALLQMKREAGRLQDRADIQELESLHRSDR